MSAVKDQRRTPPPVLAMKDARRLLPETTRAFVREGIDAEPVFFGAHRKPSGVMLSYERYLRMLDVLDDLAIALEVRKRDQVDTGERLTLEDLIKGQGFNPSDFGLE